jgi:hypothetical protein
MKTITRRALIVFISLVAIALGSLAQAITPQQYATMLLTGVGGSGGGGATLTYTATDISKPFSGTSFTTVNIGTVAADRTIVVTAFVSSNAQAGCENAGAAPAVTVGGVTMNSVTQAGESSGGQCQYIFWLFAPSGVLNASSATIAFSGFNISNVGLAVGNINGSTTTSVNASTGNSWSGGGTVADPRGVPGDIATGVAVASGGVVMTGMGIDRSVTMSPNSSNTTVDANINTGGGVAFMAAHGTNGSPNFNGATNFNANFVIASFKP